MDSDLESNFKGMTTILTQGGRIILVATTIMTIWAQSESLPMTPAPSWRLTAFMMPASAAG